MCRAIQFRPSASGHAQDKSRTLDGLDEEIRRDVEEDGKLLGMRLTDGPFPVDHVRHLTSGVEDGNEMCLLQTSLFHEIRQHFMGTRIWQRMMLFFIILDKSDHQIKGRIFFPTTVLALIHHLLDLGK